MKRFDRIDAARRLLMLPEQATMDEIKASFRRCVQEWHPDKCQHPVEKCEAMTVKIVESYRLLIDYCSRYKYSFSEESVRNHLSEEEWWFERFGQDPVWGK